MVSRRAAISHPFVTEELLNTDRDALLLMNGVILLQSAELVPHHPKVRFPGATPSLGGGTKTLLIGLAFLALLAIYLPFSFSMLCLLSHGGKMQARLVSSGSACDVKEGRLLVEKKKASDLIEAF
jgi:hypothetical protein